MDFSVRENDMGPLGKTFTIFAEGKIEMGDAAELARLIDEMAFRGRRDVHVVFSSPGGSLYAGLQIGRLLRALGDAGYVITTDVGRPNGPGTCASACVLAYAGGHYRFLQEASRLGVHRFSIPDRPGMRASEALEDAQVVSAEIVDFLEAMGLDLALFRLMSDTPSSDIAFLSVEVLEETGLVNRAISWEEEEYVYVDGVFWSSIRQQSFYGKTALSAQCNESREPVFLALLQPGFGLPPEVFDTPVVRIGGHPVELTTSTISHGGPVSLLVFQLTSEGLDRILAGEPITVRLAYPELDAFFGTTFERRAVKMGNFIAGCLGRGRPSAASGLTGLEVHTYESLDFFGNDLTDEGVRPVTWEECVSLCRADDECVAVSHVPEKAWCWPKSSVSNLTRRPTVVSGIVRQ